MNTETKTALYNVEVFNQIFKNKPVLENKMKGISYRKLIDLKCKDCVYDPYSEGNWRQQTGNCIVTLCPLYAVRPKSKAHAEKQPNIDTSEA